LQDEQDRTTSRNGIKRWRTTLIAVIVFAALAAYVLLVEMRRERPTEQEPTPTPVPLLGLSIDDVRSLHITSSVPMQDSPHLVQLEIAHQELEWRLSVPDASSSSGETCLVDPDGCVADPYIIHIAVDDLCHLSAQRILLEETSDLGQYGLDPISLVVNITMRTGEQTEIHIGKQTPDQMSYYTQRAGDPRLYLAAQYTLQPFFEWLKKPPYQPTPVVTTTPEPE